MASGIPCSSLPIDSFLISFPYSAAVISAKSRNWFEFCFVPLIPMNSTHVWLCSICQWQVPLQQGSVDFFTSITITASYNRLRWEPPIANAGYQHPGQIFGGGPTYPPRQHPGYQPTYLNQQKWSNFAPLYICIPRNLIVYLDYLLWQRCHIVDSMYYLCNLILFFFTLLEQNNMVPAAPITQPTAEHRTETRSIFLSPAARVPRTLAEGEGAGSCPRSLVNSTMAWLGSVRLSKPTSGGRDDMASWWVA